ncbi:MAG: hypothetical protein JWL77_312 [Chthonomonadaceae bacterium]|nr:hypothetical protein [Chthonomonadaceae bacterium]
MRGLLSLILLLLVPQAAQPTSVPQTDGKSAFRTDTANQNLPWYRLKPGEFPPLGSEHRVGGELVETDVIHRAGVFRRDGDGELVSFTLPPFGSVSYLDAEADLRDVPLGTHLQFCLYMDERGVFSQAARIQDKDSLTNTHTLATEQQRKQHFAFLKARGLPAWIDRVDGDRITVTLFGGDPASLQVLFQAEGIDPARWAKEHRRIAIGVANEHLRSYLPNVTNRGATVQEFQSVPTDCYGCSGVRLILQSELMLEGFRKGRVVRLFAPSWPIEAMPFGEGLYAGGHDEEPADSKELQSADFPYRTDFGNENLPWYQLQPGKAPPDHSEHRVGGELVKIDAAHRSGRFRMDRTGELVDFTLPPVASVRYLNAEAALEDLPLGMRCLFFLYQDEKGAFTRAAVIEDEFSYLASNTLTYRFEAAHLDAGKFYVVRHAAPVQTDYVLEPRVPLDFGRIELEVDDRTRVWKGDLQVKLSDIAAGDELLVNLAARTTTSRGRCTDIWVGAETHRLATEQQRKRHFGIRLNDRKQRWERACPVVKSGRVTGRRIHEQHI